MLQVIDGKDVVTFLRIPFFLTNPDLRVFVGLQREANSGDRVGLMMVDEIVDQRFDLLGT